MMGWIFAGVFAWMISQASGGSRKITTGTAQLKAGKAYRIELEVDGPAVRQAPNPADVARGLDNGLRMAGAYDVMVSPTFPLKASYSLLMPGDLPIVLNVGAQQTIGGLQGTYTFRSVQQIATARAA
jgi:X-X-X-Leu-X-X-Gly heptad repeat protein